MKWVVRPIVAGDVDAVSALEQAVPEAPHWKPVVYERCVAAVDLDGLQRAGFVAETENGLTGFAIGKLVAGVSELESVAVAENARGQGVGKALLSAVMKWARVNGAVRIDLEVRASNVRAIRLYEHAGLCREGVRPGYYRDPEEDAVLMGASLAPGGKPAEKTHCQ